MEYIFRKRRWQALVPTTVHSRWALNTMVKLGKHIVDFSLFLRLMEFIQFLHIILICCSVTLKVYTDRK